MISFSRKSTISMYYFFSYAELRLMIAFTPRKQALHDYISKTLVIKGFSFSETRSDKIKYAGFWKRFGAGFTDALITNFIILAWAAFIMFILNIQMNGDDIIHLLKAENLKDIKILATFITASLLFNWMYYAFFLSSKYQGTPGMRMISLQIQTIWGTEFLFGVRRDGMLFQSCVGFSTEAI